MYNQFALKFHLSFSCEAVLLATVRYIVSDCGAIVDMHRDTPYAPTSEEAVADALNAGNFLLSLH